MASPCSCASINHSILYYLIEPFHDERFPKSLTFNNRGQNGLLPQMFKMQSEAGVELDHIGREKT